MRKNEHERRSGEKTEFSSDRRSSNPQKNRSESNDQSSKFSKNQKQAHNIKQKQLQFEKPENPKIISGTQSHVRSKEPYRAPQKRMEKESRVEAPTIAILERPASPILTDLDHAGFFIQYWQNLMVVDVTGKILAETELHGDPAMIAEKLLQLQQGNICEEFNTLNDFLAPIGLTALYVEDARIKKAFYFPKKIPFRVGPAEYFRDLRMKLFAKNTRPQTQIASLYAQKRLQVVQKLPEKIITRLLRIVHRLEKSQTVLAESLDEITGIYPPSIVKQTNKLDFGAKEEINVLSEMNHLQNQFLKTGKNIELALKIITDQYYNTLSTLIGPKMTAEFIVQSNGLKALALMPAGRIQILGAHLRTKNSPPKYGLLYHSDLLSKVPQKDRGSLARTLSALIALAAKYDYQRSAQIISSVALTPSPENPVQPSTNQSPFANTLLAKLTRRINYLLGEPEKLKKIEIKES